MSRPDIKDIAARAALAQLGCCSCAVDACAVCEAQWPSAADVPALLAYVAELEHGVDVQAATIRGLETELVGARSQVALLLAERDRSGS